MTLSRRLIALGLVLGPLSACGDSSPGSRDDTADTDDTQDVEVDARDTALADADLADTARDADAPEDSGDTAGDAADDTADAHEEVIDTLDTFEASDGDVDTGPPACPWEPWNEGLVGGRVGAAAFDPRTPGTAWSFSGGVLFRSTDDGDHWEVVHPEIGANRIAFPPGRPKELITGSGDGLWVTRDSGQSFDRLALGGLEITALLLDPALPDRIFAGFHSLGILRSDDRGQTWNPQNSGIGRVRITSLAGFADTPNLLLAGTVLLNDAQGVTDKGQILRTVDGGRNWQLVSSDSRWTADLEVCPTDPDRVIAATRGGARISEDRGLTWQPIPSLAGLDVLDLVFSPTDCSTFWVVAYQRGIYRVEDAGATLIGPLSAGLDLEVGALDGALSIHPTRPGVLLLGTHGGLFKSENRGTSWRRLDAARGLQISDLSASRAEPGRVFITTWGGGLWTRSDTATWSRVGSLDADFDFAVHPDPEDPLRIVVGGARSSWLTTSGLDGFRALPASPTTPRNVLTALFSPAPEGSSAARSVLVGTQVDGFVRSDDDGLTWQKKNDGLTPWPTPAGTFVDIRAIVADADDPRRLYGGTRGRGVVVSDDGGETWAFRDNMLSTEIASRLVRGDNGELFAMVEGLGVFRSTDGAETWTETSRALGALELRDFVRDPVSGKLYLAIARSPLLVSDDDGATWSPLARWCLDAEDFIAIDVVTDVLGARWLVGAKGGNAILRTAL